MSTASSATIVSKVWNYAHVLKNAGVGYGDYVEVRAARASITYLLLAPTFGLRAGAQPCGLPPCGLPVSPRCRGTRLLKLADEMTELGFDPPSPRLRRAGNPIPAEFQWSELSGKSGDELEVHYRHTLENLGKEPGLVGLIFRKAQNKIANPSDLARVIKMIADEDWSGMDVDIKGAIYEGCEPHGQFLEKTASSSDKGAGQYFTPRPLIRAIVEVTAPTPGQFIGDPACGTGGFLLAAHDYISQHNQLNKPQKQHLKTAALRGTDIVPGVVSLCAMNLYLHGIGGGKVAEASRLSSSKKNQRRDASATVANQIHYRHTLENLGTEPGLVGIIFRKAQNKISNPSDLQNLLFSRKSLFSRLGKLDKLREIS